MIDYIYYTAVHRQIAITLSSEIVLSYSACVTSDVQSLIAKVLCNNFLAKIFLCKIEMLGEIRNI